MAKRSGTVSLIGAGPGDPGLLTLKALRAIEDCDVVVYDRLVSSAVLDLVPAGVTRICVGKRPGDHPVPQHEINRLLIRLARNGRRVVRLKGGDPFIFGRGGEELVALCAAGVVVDVVPGITAAQGCAASALVPLTHRGCASGVHYITGHCQAGENLDLDWAGLASPRSTLVVYMGRANLGRIAGQLISHGRAPSTPVLALCNGTTPDERRLEATLGTVSKLLEGAGLTGPVLLMIGEVVDLANHRATMVQDENALARHG